MSYTIPVIPGDIIRYSQIYHRPDLHITRRGKITITSTDIKAVEKFFSTGEKTK